MAVPSDAAPAEAAEADDSPPRSKWPAADGTPLHVREWKSAGLPWARVLIVHGIGEHSGRYDRTGRLMAEAGLYVQAFDLRGHGLSGGRRVYVSRWDDYLDDLEVRLASLREPDEPLVLFGHSMGALIALTYVCSGRPAPDLLVLSAPPLEATVPGWQRALAPILSLVAPTVVLANPITADQLARDPAVGVVPACGLTLEEVVYPDTEALAARATETRAHRSPLTPTP